MNSYLETAIAVILVIFIFSIIAYVIQELIAANLQYRGTMLKNSLKLLLDGESGAGGIVDIIYKHPQINKLKENVDRLPSYVPAANFALAIIDSVAEKTTPTGNLYTDFRNGIAAFAGSDGDLKKILTNYINTSKDLKELQENIEKWFNEYMDRVTGWYKKSTRTTLRIIAVIVAIGFNVDMIEVTRSINNNAGLKADLLSIADKIADEPESIKKLYEENIEKKLSTVDETYQDDLAAAKNSDDSAKITREINEKREEVLRNYTKNRVADINILLNNIDQPELPIGWSGERWDEVKLNWLMTILGWFLAAVAISMGAPFWFDLMIKLVNIRRAGIKPKDEG